MPLEEIIVGREPEDIEKYGKKGCVYLGKHVVGTGFETHLANPILMDVMRPHIILVVGKRGCLGGETKVFTNHGFKSIKEFDEKNDKIYSYDVQRQKFEWGSAELLRYEVNEELIKVEFSNGESLIMTEEHPLLVFKGKKAIWKMSKHLTINDSVFSVSQTVAGKEKLFLLNKLKISKVSKVNDIKEVFDLTVPKNHSFIANGIISHNSGKSYTGAVVAEEIMELPEELRQNLSCLLIDTMGIFWSMKSPNEPALGLLAEWDLKPKGFPILIIIPAGQAEFYQKAGIAFDEVFSIKPSELSASDWALTFGFSLLEPLGILLERTIKKLEGKNYSISDIVDQIELDKRAEEKEKLALENRFLAAEGWGIFSKSATPVESILKPGIATVLDVSLQDWAVRNLMLGILCRKIYAARVAARREEELAAIGGEVKRKIPMTWIIMDEAHNFLGTTETAASGDLLTLVTQGRQPGISCVFITQRPNKLHETAIAQADLVISHRLTSKPDLDALGTIMQTYLLTDIRKTITELPKSKGSALILDDNSERLFKIQVRPRYSWHAGATPIALAEKPMP